MTLIQGVDAGGNMKPTSCVAAPISVPGANGAEGMMDLRGDEPPRSAAGLVQRTSMPDGAWPKSAFDGTGASNVENAVTQPS